MGAHIQWRKFSCIHDFAKFCKLFSFREGTYKFCRNARIMMYMNFHENPPNASPHIVMNVFLYSHLRKVP